MTKKTGEHDMGDFFHGWRRKVGFLTLGLALVFMAGWMRSVTTSDWVERAYTDETCHQWASCQGTISWTFFRIRSIEIARPERRRFIWDSGEVFPGEDFETGQRRQYSVTWRRFGFYCSWDETEIQFFLRYQTIVLTLAILSACLLLIRPSQKPVPANNQTVPTSFLKTEH